MTNADVSQIAGAVLGATVSIVVMTIIKMMRTEY